MTASLRRTNGLFFPKAAVKKASVDVERVLGKKEGREIWYASISTRKAGLAALHQIAPTCRRQDAFNRCEGNS